MKRSHLLLCAEWGASLTLATVFAIAALPKIADPQGFAVAVSRYNMLPDAGVNAAAIFLPWLELTCAFAVAVLTPARRGALWLIIALLVVFSVAMALAFAGGNRIPCGCFSSDSADPGLLGWNTIARNAALILLAGCALLARRRASLILPQLPELTGPPGMPQ